MTVSPKAWSVRWKNRIEAPGLTDAEKCAIHYADLSATDHFSINDATFADLRRFYTEAEIVELGMFIAFFIGYGRLGAAWDMVEELPQAFRTNRQRSHPGLRSRCWSEVDARARERRECSWQSDALAGGR